MLNLKNKKVLITGATGGIGNCLVQKFNDFGSQIIATGTNQEKLDNLQKKFNNIYVEKFKLDEHDKIENFIEKGLVALGGIDRNNIRKLSLINISGFAGISYFKKKGPHEGAL